jgi:GT2 family glycosyltransferase
MRSDSPELRIVGHEAQVTEGRADLAHVCVIVLNWNGWQDTIECLESLWRLSQSDIQIIVVDNGSTDDSCDRILEWAIANRRDDVPYAGHHPSQEKPQEDGSTVLFATTGFVVIEAETNGGYAAGNNVGIRWALASTDCELVWILNNDCVVEPDSLSCMMKAMSDDSQVQICGATVRSYQEPNRILMTGGTRLSHVTFHSTPVVLGVSERTQEIVQKRLSYVSGACMLVRRSLFERVGLLSESYFLFFEEPDFMERAGRDCRLAVAFDAIVYHKEGGTTGSVSATRHKSPLADYYSFRSRLVFVSAFYAHRLWLVWLELPIYALARLAVGRPANANGVLRAGRDYLRLQHSATVPRSGAI